MKTRPSPALTAFALALLVTALTSCGGNKEKSEPGGPRVPALRFAGVDLEYALNRIAAEADWVLCLDEIKTKDQSPDLALIRVDLDLPAGTLEETLRTLDAKIGNFDYELDNGVVYVRSNMLVSGKTSIDMPLLDGEKFHGELVELVKHIMIKHPSSFISVSHIQGGFAGPPVDVEIAPNASVKDALITYARNAKAGWVMRRAGQITKDAQGNVAVISTTIQPRAARKTTSRMPLAYNKLSGAAALADATIRLKSPIVVYDRTVLQDVRGMLNFALKSDPKLSMNESLDVLGSSGFGPTAWHFHWREEDGVPVVLSRQFLWFLRGRDLFAQQLLPGEFEGSLPELARWVNAHQKSPNGEVLMGGEIAEGQARGKITIVAGDTVNTALVKFAKASGVSPYLLVLDMQNPISGAMIQDPRAWRGAFLQDLSEWRTMPGDERATGVIKDE